MPIDLYYAPMSPPCRSVLMIGETLGINFNLIELDVREKKEQLSPKFLAINPQHTIPTIVDGDFSIWESRAILTYLADTYGKNDSLYPKNAKLRAQIDFLLCFDLGTLSERVTRFVVPVISQGAKPELKNLESLHEALGWLNQFLEGHFFAAGNRITIADFALVATVGLIDACSIDIYKYPRVSSWYTRCMQQMRGYDKINKGPMEAVKNMVKGKLRVQMQNGN